MIVRSTCDDCGRELVVTALGQRTHPACHTPPGTPDGLAAVLAAVLAAEYATAGELAATVHQAGDASAELSDAATAYARSGWPVFPCRPGDKTPATTHGFRDATTDTARITRWWQRHPDSNIGVATGHLFDVIDIDYTSHPDALDWWIRTKEDSDLEIDGLAATPRGLHAYVTPSGAGNSSKLFGITGVDYRGIGGYVVVAPSIREDGRYQWWVRPSPRIMR